VIELSRAFSTSLKDHTEKKYSMTALKRVAQLLAKLSELYPSVASPLIHTLLLDKLPHKNTAVDS
jgi:mRNA-degrading endonuclease YafQ of YafQ-DinJ toxin-antitoxin module